MAENEPLAGLGQNNGNAGKLLQVLAAGTAVIAIVMAVFGTTSYELFDSIFATRYKVSDAAMTALSAAGVPDVVRAKIATIKDTRFETKDKFLQELGKCLGKDELERFQSLILSHTAFAGKSWAALGYLVGMVGAFILFVQLLKKFFIKCNGRIIFALWLVSILGAYCVFLFSSDKYPMGIDLAGGAELIYRLDFTQADRNIDAANKSLADAKDREKTATDKDAAAKKVREWENQVFTLEQGKKTAPDKAAEVVRRRIDPTGTKGIPVSTMDASKLRLRIQLPKATPQEVERIKKAIETQGRLTFHIVSDDQEIIKNTKDSKTKTYTDKEKIEYELKVIKKPKPYSDTGETVDEDVVMERVPGMDGSKITLAMARRSTESTGFEISVRFSAQGQVEFGNMTGAHVKKRMAIMLDGTVHSAPTIQERIDGECRISGSFAQDEAEKLAGVLTAGSLPAEVKYDSEFNVGPTLGAEQVASGMQATIIGTAGVVGFMLIYYRLSGIIAAFCTALNILMLLGAMGFFKATLTLPGIAGIVLTLGMAVDANVLILERMREEYARGRPIRLAVAHGYDRAFLTIIDCNLTTLISGIVLYYMGTGPVKGFAVTLSLGILTTLFCNLWINGVLMEWLVAKEALGKLNMMQFFKTTAIDFMGWRKVWYTMTGSLAVISIVLLIAFAGRYFDVDFRGGTLVQFNFTPAKAKDFETVKARIEKEIEPTVNARVAEVLAKENEKALGLVTQSFGKAVPGGFRSYTVTTKIIDQEAINALKSQILKTFEGDLEPDSVVLDGNKVKIRFDVSPSLTADVAKQRVKDALVKLAGDSENQDIKQTLVDLPVVAAPESEGGAIVAEVGPLPDDGHKEKTFKAIASERIIDRAGGPIGRTTSFGKQVANDLWLYALGALIVANICVFIYLWFRFEFSGAWGFGAIVALIHDVVIAAGSVIVANLAGFTIGIDLNVIAALLTIVGFSVNDTIVVFDRIREVKHMHPTRPYEEIVNEAINATLSRTILTSLTVIIADVALLIFGGTTIRGLAFTLLIGFTVGTYSSIFIASPLMIWWYRRFGGGVAPVPVKTAPSGDQNASGAEV